jgi:glycerol-3-phosphate dehydrogenase (NAD(P)+)
MNGPQVDDSIRAAVLGEDSMGCALAHVIASPGRACTLWSSSSRTADVINQHHQHPRLFPSTKLAPRLVATTSLVDAVRDVPLIIVSVPSARFREMAEALGDIVKPDQMLLSSTKGLEPHSLERMSELLGRYTRARDVGAIGGANITPDIMAGKLTALLVASPSLSLRKAAQRALELPRVRIYGTDDLLGAELVSALKNVSAIASGIAMGLGLSLNTVALALTRSFAEIRRLCIALGASGEPLLDLCGIGDLFLSCTHGGSLNRRVGLELGAGRSLSEIARALDEAPEGINTVNAAVELARRHDVRMPIAKGVQAIMGGSLPVAAFEELIVED